MKIKAILSMQNGQSIFSAKMTVKQLAQVTTIDIADPTIKQKGYQRKGTEKRFDQIASYLTGKNAIMPPPIIMSFRGELIAKKTSGGFIELDVPDGDKLWVIDGQHRLGGLKLLAGLNDTEGSKKYSKKYKKYHEVFSAFEMPVVIIQCASRSIEALQFAVINGEAKKVDVFLANSAINQGGGTAPTGANAWRSRATDIVHELNTNPMSVLQGRIRHPNAPKGKYFCTAKGLMNMMEPIMNDSIYAAHWDGGNTGRNRICKMLIDYWCAWKSEVPFCFDEHVNFALFKNSGLMLANMCLMTMIRIVGEDYPNYRDLRDLISKLGPYKKREYWHKNASDGINRRIGASQIKQEAKLVSAYLAKKTGN